MACICHKSHRNTVITVSQKNPPKRFYIRGQMLLGFLCTHIPYFLQYRIYEFPYATESSDML